MNKPGACFVLQPRRTRRLTSALDHAQSSLYALGQLYRAPIASLLTTLVIAIALALPSMVVILLYNGTQLVDNLSTSGSVSLFLRLDVDQTAASKLAERLRRWDTIRSVTVISKEQGLREFEAQTKLTDSLALLTGNPLPVVLEIEPASGIGIGDRLNAFVRRLETLPEIEVSRFDRQWVQRIHAWIGLLESISWIVAALIGVGVVVIVGNTIRLSIDQYRNEVVIFRLVGATDAFVRRPFLYTGLWYGFAGSVIALLLLWLAIWSIADAVSALTATYHAAFTLVGLNLYSVLMLLIAGSTLGLVGAWISVARHLRQGFRY